MPTPVGHLIVSYLVYSTQSDRFRNRGVLIGSLFSGVAADLDFLPGLLVGDPGRFHHGASHSLGAAVLYGFGLCGYLRYRGTSQALQLTLLLACAYVSHVILDFFAIDTGAPFGVPLLWPVSSTSYIASFPVFLDVQRLQAETVTFVTSVFSSHNLLAVTWEVLLLAPMVIFAQRRKQPQCLLQSLRCGKMQAHRKSKIS
jgi:inner membrane protein